MSTGAKGNRPTRNQKREAARAKARELREQQIKAEKRKKIFLQGGIALGIIAVAAIVVSVIVNQPPNTGPRPANMATDGVILSGQGMAAIPSAAGEDGAEPIIYTPGPEDPVNIVIYQDYICPACKAYAQQLEILVQAGAATLEIHPVGMLDRFSGGTKYSSRASAASACVAEYSPDTFWKVNQAFFVNQPAEGTTGLSDDELKKIIASQQPQNKAQIDECIDSKKFMPWVKEASDRALSGPMQKAASDAGWAGSQTPTVIVNGKVYTGSIVSPQELLAFITQVAGETSPTPTPTPSAG